MPGAVAGSWFPSGFHGNFRGHFRNDFYQEYRKEATPQPPHMFVQRMKEPSMKHTFSRHDNRHIFPSSVSSFENGMGKKKVCKTGESSSSIYWTSLEEQNRQRPLVSTYRTDFWGVNERSEMKFPQLLVPRFRRLSSALHTENTTYRQMVQPHQFVSFEIMHKPNTQQSIVKSRSYAFDNSCPGEGKMTNRGRSAPVKLLTVSDCLVWTTPKNTTLPKSQTSETA
ncbi:uncharacterized protein C3orf84 homolog [Pelobates fuscus]|uniref:uncharacterized protein C3orf84 homolog n=1 Tax=Pelobates fuscus TaxID=191477 RepID=UPI002FE46690